MPNTRATLMMPMPLNGGFAFAHAGVAQNQDALAVDLHQHAVAGDAGRQLGVQRGDQHAHQGGGHLGRKQDGYAVLLGKLHHFRKRLQPAGQNDGGRLELKQLFQVGPAQAGRNFLQIGHFGQPDDLQAVAVEVFVVAGQQHTGAAGFGSGDLDFFQFAGGVGNGQVGFAGELCQRHGKFRQNRTLPSE